MVYPNIFLEAIGLVGGVGIDVIFGILPGVLLIKYGRGNFRFFGYVIVICFSVVLAYELAQELGLLHIQPGCGILECQSRTKPFRINLFLSYLISGVSKFAEYG